MASDEVRRLNDYVRWNQLTPHQIIVAHLMLIQASDENNTRLAKAFGLDSYVGTADVIDQVIAKWRETKRKS